MLAIALSHHLALDSGLCVDTIQNARETAEKLRKWHAAVMRMHFQDSRHCILHSASSLLGEYGSLLCSFATLTRALSGFWILPSTVHLEVLVLYSAWRRNGLICGVNAAPLSQSPSMRTRAPYPLRLCKSGTCILVLLDSANVPARKRPLDSWILGFCECPHWKTASGFLDSVILRFCANLDGKCLSPAA